MAVVLGSAGPRLPDALARGLGATVTEVPVADLGGFPPSTVPGHAGLALSLVTPELRLLVLVGRVHLYEGHPPSVVVHGVRTAVAARCRVVALTNAAGGIAPGYPVGQPVLIRDHLNLTGRSPLAGRTGRPGVPVPVHRPHRPVLGPAAGAGPGGRSRPGRGGVRAMPGPHYETPAEIRMLPPRRRPGRHVHRAGNDRRRQLGAEVLGISLVTNPAAGLAAHGLDHAEVVAAGQAAAGRMGALLAQVLPRTT